jgi:TetR/AcrR family transcriptional regulator
MDDSGPERRKAGNETRGTLGALVENRARGPERERRGRTHDAESARRAILDAAEEVFAEHGFDGARVDAIAAIAGYNKSLIFQYFGDKLNLYAEVLRRADRQGTEVQAQVFAILLEDPTITTDAHKFRGLLEIGMNLAFEYLEKNPRILRIITWEQAEGWQSWKKTAGQMNMEDIAQFRVLCSKAQEAGLLRPGADPLLLLLMAEQMYMSYLTSLPLYEMVLPVDQASSPETLARVKEHIIEFLIHGILNDPAPKKEQNSP